MLVWHKKKTDAHDKMLVDEGLMVPIEMFGRVQLLALFQACLFVDLSFFFTAFSS